MGITAELGLQFSGGTKLTSRHISFSFVATRSWNPTSMQPLCLFFVVAQKKAMERVVDVVVMEQFLDALAQDIQICREKI